MRSGKKLLRMYKKERVFIVFHSFLPYRKDSWHNTSEGVSSMDRHGKKGYGRRKGVGRKKVLSLYVWLHDTPLPPFLSSCN